MAGTRASLCLVLSALLGCDWLPTVVAQAPLTCASVTCQDIPLSACAAIETTKSCSLSETRCATIVVKLAGGPIGIGKGCIAESECIGPDSCNRVSQIFLPGITVESCQHDCCTGPMCNAGSTAPAGLISILNTNIAFLQGILSTVLPVLRSRIQRQSPVCTALIRKLDFVSRILNDFLKAKQIALERVGNLRRDSAEDPASENSETKRNHDSIVERLIKQMAAQQYRDPHRNYWKSHKNYGHHHGHHGYRKNNYRPYKGRGSYKGRVPYKVHNQLFGRDELIKIINNVIVTEQSFVPQLQALLHAGINPRPEVTQETSSLLYRINSITSTLRQSIPYIRTIPSNCYNYGHHGHRYGYGYSRSKYGDARQVKRREFLLKKLDAEEKYT